MENLRIKTKTLEQFVANYNTVPETNERKIVLFDNHRSKLESLKFFIV